MIDGLMSAMRPEGSFWRNGLINLCDDVKEHIGDEPIIVELGSYMGESSAIFAQKFPKGKVYCIDSWVGGFDDTDSCSVVDYGIVEQQFDLRASMFSNIIKLKGLSTDFGIKCDLIYIDACHKYECVKNDIIHWKPFVKKVISGHDYCKDEQELNNYPHIRGVAIAIDELLGTPDMNFCDFSWYKRI